MEEHRAAVRVLAAYVRQFYDRKEAFRIYHGSTNSTRQLAFQRDRTIDTSQLSHVLEVDVQRKTALVEPNVPMDRLVEATLAHGLIPPVVMEFPGITVGGGFAGTAGESSSFRHGFFHRTVEWIEMVLADGETVTASETEKPDLFYGAAGSFGTLGVTTLLELRLMEARPHVELTYHPVSSVPEAVEKIKEATTDESNDYVDGILFALDQGVIMTGRLTCSESVRSQRFTRARDPWFYLHARDATQKGTSGAVVTETVPLVDYLFRYDRGAFWTGAYAFQYFITPFNRITRWVLDQYMHTRVMYRAMHESGLAQRYLIQDVALPASTAQTFIEYINSTLGIYPLWLCPLRRDHQVALHPRASPLIRDDGTTREMLINVGVWGPGPTDPTTFVSVNRHLEHKVQQLWGFKWLYARAYYTEDEFWEVYDRTAYDALRAKYRATSLPSVYDKVSVDPERATAAVERSWQGWTHAAFWSIWPLSGLWGVFKATMGGEYILAKG